MENETKGRRRIALVIGALAVIAGGLMLGEKAQRDKGLPQALSQTALVCSINPYSSADSKPAGNHKHDLKTLWDLVPGESEIDIHKKWFKDKHFFDVAGDGFNELQDPDVYILNDGSYPVRSQAAYPNGCKQPPVPHPFYAKESLVFAFAIHKIKNSDGKKTPHALLFLPINTKPGIPDYTAQEFKLNLYHMEPSEDACTSVKPPVPLEPCKALARLRNFWETPGYTDEQFKAKVNDEIKTILGFRELSAAEIAADSRLEGLAFELEEIRNHNGVIHGIF